MGFGVWIHLDRFYQIQTQCYLKLQICSKSISPICFNFSKNNDPKMLVDQDVTGWRDLIVSDVCATNLNAPDESSMIYTRKWKWWSGAKHFAWDERDDWWGTRTKTFLARLGQIRFQICLHEFINFLLGSVSQLRRIFRFRSQKCFKYPVVGYTHMSSLKISKKPCINQKNLT